MFVFVCDIDLRVSDDDDEDNDEVDNCDEYFLVNLLDFFLWVSSVLL